MGILDKQERLPQSGVTIQYSSLFPVADGVPKQIDRALLTCRLSVRKLQRQLHEYGGEKIGFNGTLDHHFRMKDNRIKPIFRSCYIEKIRNGLNLIGNGLEEDIVIKDYRREAMIEAVILYVAEATPDQLQRDISQVNDRFFSTRLNAAKTAMNRDGATDAVTWLKQPGILSKLMTLTSVKNYVKQNATPDPTVFGEVRFKKSVRLRLSDKDMERFKSQAVLPEIGVPGPESHSEITLAFDKVPDWNDQKLCLNLIHEASHKFAATLDICYAYEKTMADYKKMPIELAVANADSYGMACISVHDEKLYETSEDVQALSGSRFIECMK